MVEVTVAIGLAVRLAGFGLLVCTLAGCAAVDARPDFDATARVIRERTGSHNVYVPGAARAVVVAAVASLLRDGLHPDEAVRIAMLQNPRLQSRFQDIGVSRAELVRAGLPANPTLLFGSRFPEGGGLANLTVSLTQNLLDLLLIPTRTRAATAELQSARYEAARFAVELAAEVRKTCYETLALRQSQRMNTEEIAFAARGLSLARHRLAAGQGDVIDVNLARNAQLATERDRLRLRRDLLVKRAALAELLGLRGAAGDWSLTGALPRIDPSKGSSPSTDLTSLQELARRERLDIRIAHLGVRAAEARVDLENVRRWPNLAVGIDGERAESPPNLLGPSLVLTPRLWDANRPESARRGFELVRSRHRLDTVLASVAREVHQSAAAVTNNAELVRLFESRALPLARENVTAAEAAYRAGQRDMVAYLATQGALFEQRAAYRRTLLEYVQALAALEAAVGGRLPVSR
jgi:outer membrane protein, heavy metal efflux system